MDSSHPSAVDDAEKLAVPTPRIVGSTLGLLKALWWWQLASQKQGIVSHGAWTGAAGPVPFAFPTQVEMSLTLNLDPHECRQVRTHLTRLESARLIRVGMPHKDLALREEIWRYEDAGLIVRGGRGWSNVYHVLVDPRHLDEANAAPGPRRRHRPRARKRARPMPPARPDQPQLFAGDVCPPLNNNDRQSTAGHDRQSTAGHDRQSTAGHDRQSTAGHDRQSTAGHDRQSTAGHDRQSTAGPNGCAPYEGSNTGSSQQQHSANGAAAAVKSARPETPEKCAAARAALAGVGLPPQTIDALVTRGSGLCLLAVRLAAHEANNPPGFVQRCVERPLTFGVYRLHAWDDDDTFSGWRPAPSSKLATELKAADAPLQAAIVADRRERERADERAADAERRGLLARELHAAWESRGPAGQEQIRAAGRAQFGGKPAPLYWCQAEALRLLRGAPRSVDQQAQERT